jgi:hypothetical protein
MSPGLKLGAPWREKRGEVGLTRNLIVQLGVATESVIGAGMSQLFEDSPRAVRSLPQEMSASARATMISNKLTDSMRCNER